MVKLLLRLSSFGGAFIMLTLSVYDTLQSVIVLTGLVFGLLLNLIGVLEVLYFVSSFS